ncbi:MAG: TonB-dependent receptor family protein [Gammaproteobacteria bacterium]
MPVVHRLRSPVSVAVLTLSGGVGAETAEPGDAESVTALPAIEVIGSASRLPEIAGAATIIDAQELRQSRVFTINEALRKAPGVHVRDEEGFALRPNIGLRGLNPTRSTKVLLLEDGMPLAYAPYGDNASYYHPPVERFDSIEVLKGSEQILFGPQTIGGVINYVTPTPPQAFEGGLTLSGGSRDYVNGRLRLGGKGMLMDYMRKQGDGSRDNEETEIDDFNFKGVYSFLGNQAITLRASYYGEDSSVGYSGLTDAELRNFGYRYHPFDNDNFNVDRTGASATHEIAFSSDLVLTTNVYFTHFKRDWWRQASTTTDGQCGAAFTNARLAGRRVDPDTCNSVQGRQRSYYTYGVEPRLFARHDWLGVESEFQAGVRAHYESQDRIQQNGVAATARAGTIVENQEREVDAYSLFAQNRVLLGQFTVTPGVRVEYVDNTRLNNLTGGEGDDDVAEVIPGFGVTWNPRDTVTFFGGVHRGFAPPRVEDLIVTPAGAAIATFTDVDVEKSWNAELGVRTDLRPGAHVEATVFRNDFENQIQVGSIAGGATPLAQGETLYEGLELAVRFDSQQLLSTRDNWYLQLAYTWLPTADQETPVTEVANGRVVAGSREGKRLPYAPEHLATTMLGYTHASGFDVRLEAVHTSSQFADFANTEFAPVNGNGQIGRIKSSTIFNLAASYPVRKYDATLFLAAKNLMDRDYIVDRTRGIRVGMPLLVQGGVEIAF